MGRHRNIEKENLILKLLTTQPLTFKKVGEILGVSRQFIYQIYKRARKEHEIKRFPIFRVNGHRIDSCKICQKLIEIFGRDYDVIAINALRREIGLASGISPSPHLLKLRKAGLVNSNPFIFESDRMAEAFVYYKKTNLPAYRIGKIYGYKNFNYVIWRMRKLGVNIDKQRNVKALLNREN